MFTSTEKYQTTSPRDDRVGFTEQVALTLGAGDRIEFIIERDGVRVRRALPADVALPHFESTLARHGCPLRTAAGVGPFCLGIS